MVSSILLVLLCVEPAVSQVVVTAQGRLQGVPHDGYVSYQGVPYATLKQDWRFKQAGIAPSWVGTRESSAPSCSPSSEPEECLRLDVHVPTAGSAPWPVFVWVRASPGPFQPRKIVQQGVILVVVYHRFGPVGFLCLTEEAVPGNVGAKDVVVALRWVRDNIVAFRGNQAKVVVAGQGFGAAIVEAMTLSPMAQGLYQGAILQSGTILSPLSFNYDAIERANSLGVVLSDGQDAVSSFLTSDISELVANSKNLQKPYFPFGLCIEKSFKKEEQLITESPLRVLTNNKPQRIPVIIGYNSDEAYIFVSNLKGAKALRRTDKDVRSLLPDELKFLNEREAEAVARQISDKYFKNNRTMAALLAYYRDALFLNHIYRSARLHASAGQQVYFYQFSHNGSVGVYPEPRVVKSGAAHSDELAYLFSERDLEGDDGSVQQKLVKLWTNFAKYLTPTPRVGDSSTWDPVDAHSPRLLNIGPELRMESFPHSATMAFWDDVYEKYYHNRYHSY